MQPFGNKIHLKPCRDDARAPEQLRGEGVPAAVRNVVTYLKQQSS